MQLRCGSRFGAIGTRGRGREGTNVEGGWRGTVGHQLRLWSLENLEVLLSFSRATLRYRHPVNGKKVICKGTMATAAMLSTTLPCHPGHHRVHSETLYLH